MPKPDRAALAIHVALLCVLATGASAQLEFSISPTPVGSGARAAGMADAFVGIADDATAASWNPAGLVQLERPEVSLVSEFNLIQDHFSADTSFDNNQDFQDFTGGLNFASVTYPLPMLIAGRNAVVGLSYQQRYDLTRKFDVGLLTQLPALGIESILNFDFDQEGALGTLTPAFAIELTSKLSIGAAVNFWRSSFINDNGWEQTIDVNTLTTITPSTGPPLTFTTTRTTIEEYDDLSGENVTAGLLWNVTPEWNLGLRYDSAFTGDIKFETSTVGSNVVTPIFQEENREMSFPATWTIAAGWRPFDKLTLALSASRTDWNDFYIEDAAGNQFSLVDGKDFNSIAHTEFDPTYTVRLGMEYVLIPSDLDADLDFLWSLRGGLFLDQEPASGRSTFDPNSTGDGKAEDFYGLAAGAGLQAFNRVNIDFAYQLRFANGVNSDRITGLNGFEEDFMQHRFLLSTIIYF